MIPRIVELKLEKCPFFYLSKINGKTSNFGITCKEQRSADYKKKKNDNYISGTSHEFYSPSLFGLKMCLNYYNL